MCRNEDSSKRLGDTDQITTAKEATTKPPEFKIVKFHSGPTLRAPPEDWEIILKLRKTIHWACIDFNQALIVQDSFQVSGTLARFFR